MTWVKYQYDWLEYPFFVKLPVLDAIMFLGEMLSRGVEASYVKGEPSAQELRMK